MCGRKMERRGRWITGFSLLLLMILPLSGCQETAPGTAYDEIACYNWVSSEDTCNTEIYIKDNNFTLKNDGKVLLNGVYFADNERITVVDNEGFITNLEYELKDEQLLLSLYDKSLAFVRREREENRGE